jgi:hypothetical protein
LEAYRATERDFRIAFDGFHSHTNSILRWVFRPALAKSIHRVIAAAHRRRGPWA